jgi:hypothetical protein
MESPGDGWPADTVSGGTDPPEGFAMMRDLMTFSVLGLLTLASDASQLLQLDVSQQADVYVVHVEMEFDAPAERIRTLLTDYDNLDRLNASITSSEVIDAEAQGAVRVRTRIRKCILFFCLNVQKVESVTQDERGRILTVIDPAASSFRSGEASWEVHGLGNRSRVVHHARLEPDLWIPPWMGIAILKDALRREIRECFENLDCLTHGHCEAPLPENTNHAWEDFTGI